MKNEEFQDLMHRVRDGSDSAIEMLWSLCNRQIIREVRRRLQQDMRSVYDSDDFAQAVWKSFYAKLPGLSDFSGPQPLIAFLTRVAHNKVVDQYRQDNTQKHDVKRQTPAEQMNEEPLISRDPTPSERAIAKEQFDRLVEGQPEPVQDVAALRREGMNVHEIAKHLNLSVARVRRMVDKLRERARASNAALIEATKMAVREAKQLASDLVAQWPKGEPFDAQAVLAENPSLRDHKSVVIDLAVEEFSQRLERGEDLAPSTFANQFSTVQRSLVEMLQVTAYLRAHDLLPAEIDTAGGVLEPGNKLMGFQLERELGQGSFSRVFLARELELGNRLVVVKFYFGGHEAEVLGKLRHKHIVPVFSVTHDEQLELSALCMPYLGQATLLDVLDTALSEQRMPTRARTIVTAIEAANEGETMEPAVLDSPRATPLLRRGQYHDGVAAIGLQLAMALQYTHLLGMRHGDIKPSNVLMMPNGDAKLFDFNLSADIGDVAVLGGTLLYMSPEQLQVIRVVEDKEEAKRLAGEISNRADLFALGVTLYEMLTGEQPFGDVPTGLQRSQAATVVIEQQQAGFVPIRQRNPRIPSKLAAIVERCLILDPDKRTPSASQLIGELRAYLNPVRRAVRWMGRNRAATAAICAALVLVGWVAVALMHEPFEEVQMRAAEAAIADRDYETALLRLDDVLEVNAENGKAHFNRGRALMRTNAFTEARTAFGQALDLQGTAEVANWIGYELASDKDFTKAAEYFEIALKKGLQTIDVYNNLGYSYGQAGKLNQAALNLGRAINIDERSATPWLNLVSVENKRGIREQSEPNIQLVQNAMQVGEPTARLWLARAVAFTIKARYCKDDEKRSECLDEAFAACDAALEKGLLPSRLQMLRGMNPVLKESERLSNLLGATPPEQHARDPSPLLVPHRYPY